MAEIFRDMKLRLELADNALKFRNGVKAWDDLTLQKLVGPGVYGNLSDDEKKLLTKDTSVNYRLLCRKMHMPVEADRAFYEAGNKAKAPNIGNPRDNIGSKALDSYLKRTVVDSIKKDKLANTPESPFNNNAIAMLGAFQYKMELAEKTAPYWKKLEDYQNLSDKFDKARDRENKLVTDLYTMGVDTRKFQNCVNLVLLPDEENPEGAKTSLDVRKISLDKASNSAMRNATLAVRQAESALIANAVVERLTKPSGEWLFVESRLTSDVKQFFSQSGKTIDKVFEKVDTCAGLLSSILPQDAAVRASDGYKTLVNLIVNGAPVDDPSIHEKPAIGCVAEGAFAFDSLKETISAMARAVSNDKVTEFIANNDNMFLSMNERGEVVSDLCYDEKGKMVDEAFAFDHNGNMFTFAQFGGKTGDVVADIKALTDISKRNSRMQEYQEAINEVPGLKVQDDFSFTDLTADDYKLKGNVLTSRLFSKFELEKRKEIEEEKKAGKTSKLPNLCPDGSFYADLSYYQQCRKAAAASLARYGLSTPTSTSRALEAAAEAEPEPETPTPEPEPRPEAEPRPEPEPRPVTPEPEEAPEA